MNPSGLFLHNNIKKKSQDGFFFDDKEMINDYQTN